MIQNLLENMSQSKTRRQWQHDPAADRSINSL